MTSSELRYEIESRDSKSYFFNCRTMKFLGDSMKNYGCRTNTVEGVSVWELWRKSPVKHGVQSSAYFRKDNFKQIRRMI